MKNYVKIFEEENVSLIKKTRIRVCITFVFFLGVFPLVCTFFLANICKAEVCSIKFIVWIVFFLIGMIFTALIEKHIKRPLKVLAEKFVMNLVIDDLINLLRTKFDFEISNEFIQNSAHGYEYSLSKEDWLNSYSFKSYYRIYFREFVFTSNNLRYKLTKVLYQNDEPFRFYFDITYSNGRIECDVEYEF